MLDLKIIFVTAGLRLYWLGLYKRWFRAPSLPSHGIWVFCFTIAAISEELNNIDTQPLIVEFYFNAMPIIN